MDESPTFKPGWVGCDQPGHPNFYSHDCAARDAAILALPVELRPTGWTEPDGN